MHKGRGNSHPKQEAFLGWQNVCSIFLGSSALIICSRNAEAASIPLAFPWGDLSVAPFPWEPLFKLYGAFEGRRGFHKKNKLLWHVNLLPEIQN